MGPEKKRVLVTGVTGFTGRHLVDVLRADSCLEIYGAHVNPSKTSVYDVCDLTDKQAVYRLMERTRPDRVYQLAGVISNDYETAYQGNVTITRHILDAVVALKQSCRVLLVGSAAEYGLGAGGPMTENRPLNPVSLYALTKVFQATLMKTYLSLYSLDIVMVRTFNLVGKGISENLFEGRVRRQIEDYRAGRIDCIRVGNLKSCRDYIPVAQAVRDYALVMNHGRTGDIYNVGLGRSVPTSDVLRSILQEQGLDMSVVREEILPLGAKLDLPEVYADITKLKKLKENAGHAGMAVS